MKTRKYGRGTQRPAPMPIDELRCLLAYNPKTGEITWLRPPKLGGRGAHRRIKPGMPAGCQSTLGYAVVRINGVLYPAHRIAWYLETGTWPPDQVDHINEIKSDNRFENLRLATHAENTHYAHQNRISREGRPDYVPSDLRKMLRNERVNIETLKQMLSYDPKTGLLTWNEDRGCNFNKRFAGTVAGSTAHRYVMIKIGNFFVAAHRIAWVLMTGSWPSRLVDHVNGNKHDNRWINLRLASPSQNMHARSGKGNKTGYRGVTRNATGFRAQIMVNKKLICFPTRATAEEAYADYCAAARRYHGEFARLD